jgi:hypothetical protein
MSRRFGPWRGMDSSPGKELLGVITSHGPSRESYRSSRKSSRSAKAIAPTAADAALSPEGVQAALSSPAATPALLQPRVPGSGAGMVTLEGPGKIPGEQGRQAATERTKPALPGAREEPETARTRGSPRGCEGHHYRTFFSAIRATGLVATWDSRVRGEVLCSTSVRQSAVAHGSACGNGSGAGKRCAI